MHHQLNRNAKGSVWDGTLYGDILYYISPTAEMHHIDGDIFCFALECTYYSGRRLQPLPMYISLLSSLMAQPPQTDRYPCGQWPPSQKAGPSCGTMPGTRPSL